MTREELAKKIDEAVQRQAAEDDRHEHVLFEIKSDYKKRLAEVQESYEAAMLAEKVLNKTTRRKLNSEREHLYADYKCQIREEDNL